jgi:hypothetical protein
VLWISASIFLHMGLLQKKESKEYIHIGDSLEKVERIYPKEWIYHEGQKCYVLKGAASHFGVVTEYTLYTLEGEMIVDIYKDRGLFEGMPLPGSNQEAKQKLQGIWYDEQGKKIRFTEDRMEEEFLNTLYEEIQYFVLSPNQIILSKRNGDKHSVTSVRMWITDETLYLFEINEKGIPIEGTVEKYIRLKST